MTAIHDIPARIRELENKRVELKAEIEQLKDTVAKSRADREKAHGLLREWLEAYEAKGMDVDDFSLREHDVAQRVRQVLAEKLP